MVSAYINLKTDPSSHCLPIPLHSNSFHSICPVSSAVPNPNQLFHAHPYPQLFAHLWFCKGKTYETLSNPEKEASAKKVPRHQVFLLLSLSFSHLERSLHLRGSNALRQAAYPWMLPTFPAILRAGSMFRINSNLSVLLKLFGQQLKAVKQDGCTVHAYLLVQLLWPQTSTFSVLWTVSIDHMSSSRSHRLNIMVPLAYTFPAQVKDITNLCSIHSNALGL